MRENTSRLDEFCDEAQEAWHDWKFFTPDAKDADRASWEEGYVHAKVIQHAVNEINEKEAVRVRELQSKLKGDLK